VRAVGSVQDARPARWELLCNLRPPSPIWQHQQHHRHITTTTSNLENLMTSDMLNVDVWLFIAEALRGDAPTSHACVLTGSVLGVVGGVTLTKGSIDAFFPRSLNEKNNNQNWDPATVGGVLALEMTSTFFLELTLTYRAA
jgi:hypothetical protein